ncbi:hypothetical protein LTR99_000475 [Exophiala xenobiotica]|uniref:Uncharacterized protein n=1 Tax=Vermiconidia calcicola TaxID=1690605 RepID=A0AAV9QLY0_9PEZI|nr:hypothetical protein H2202_004832 [Exophiala xenobiotica]KAK5543698.1 hypothetical protein LTR25_001312 [Vermiconidia calcicola]KAK5548375.1 hypothetical protein LTR23_001504 [Chaetothyriales sp. CCFEE 6169]KAK5213537.1 hypothetical protein LTR41_001116 [Exophiala xenobiotica]KAK5237849.1 hypothetical protein LTR47_000942 [Exophiala xenobiotica]
MDLTASRWASPDIRREREYQTRTRSPSPHKQHLHTHTHPLDHNVLPTLLPSKTLSQPSATSSPAPPLTSAQRLYLTRQTELQRFRRLFRRLAWKANSLTHWSHRALNLAQEHQTQNHYYDAANSHTHPGTQEDNQPPGPRASLGRYDMIIDPIEAERQFKIDFYEFYAILERGLVHLLSVWGIVITPSAPNYEHNNNTDPASHSLQVKSTTPSIIGDSRNFHGASHRFHANVLSALDHPSNPLHSILGTGDARAYIGVAKEFRNKWKDVEQRPDDCFVGHERTEETWDKAKVKRYEMVLRDLKLDELLGTVLQALEEAGRRADAEVKRLEHVAGGVSQKAREEADQTRDDRDFDMMDAPFETMTDRVDVDHDMEL